MSVRLAALVSHPIQYQAPLFRRIAATPGMDFTALFMSDHGVRPTHDPGFGKTIQFDVPLLEGYKSVFLNNLSPRPVVNTFAGSISPELARILVRERYDALWVHGYAQATTWIGFATARATDTPILLRGETPYRTEISRPFGKRLVKRAVLGPMIRGCRGLLYIGDQNRRFYELYGARPEQLFFAPYSVDNTYFAGRATEALQAGAREKLRASVGATEDDSILLFSGKLMARKRPLDLVHALTKLGPRAIGVFAGDGEQRALLESEIKRTGARAHILGFLNQSELPGWYAASDMFVLPSEYETWGLVVNEALACGLPCFVADAVGSGDDLVKNRGTGAVFKAGDPMSLADALRPFVNDRELRQRASAEARQVVAHYDVSETAKGVIAAARAAAQV